MTIVNADGITVFEPKHAMLAEAEQLLLEHPKSLVVTDLSTDETGKHTELNYVVHDTQIVTPYWAIMAFQEYKCKKTVNLSTAEPFYLKQVYTHK
jgi:tRNA A37 threonylcarbamoyladenosine modification protein TsaB